jgi:hypothetical protein
MKQNQIKDLTKLDSENLENIFNVYQDEGGMYFYNLLQTVVFPPDLPPNLFNSYSITYGDTWPFISFKAFKTPNLWWIILLANNIQDPTKLPANGSTIKIPIASVVREVLSQIGRG